VNLTYLLGTVVLMRKYTSVTMQNCRTNFKSIHYRPHVGLNCAKSRWLEYPVLIFKSFVFTFRFPSRSGLYTGLAFHGFHSRC
jgi:hypothetical protein